MSLQSNRVRRIVMKSLSTIARVILLATLSVAAFFILPSGGRQPARTDASAFGSIPAPQAQSRVQASKDKTAQTVARLKQKALAAQQEASARRNQKAEANLATLRSKLGPRPRPKPAPTVRGQLPANWRALIVEDTRRRPTGGPHIDRLEPTAAVVGKEIIIRGARFGATAGVVNLHIADMTVVCPITRWEDGQIAVTIPGGLEGVVGETAKDARLWVDPPATVGIATTALRVGPDPSHFRPSIGRVPPAIIPGELYVIEGWNFLHEQQGTVEFRLPARGVTYTCSIQTWTDTILGVRLSSSIRGIPPESGVLSVKNHLGVEITRPVTFQPLLDVDVVSESKRVNLSARDREQIVLNDFILRNFWTVLDSAMEGVFATDWARPAPGSTNCRCVVSVSTEGAGGVAEATCYVTITGPRGMPYR